MASWAAGAPTAAAAATAAPRRWNALLALVEHHREHDHGALDDGLPERRDAEDHRPSARKPMTKAPSRVPRTVPRPPVSAAPPMTTAAIAFSS